MYLERQLINTVVNSYGCIGNRRSQREMRSVVAPMVAPQTKKDRRRQKHADVNVQISKPGDQKSKQSLRFKDRTQSAPTRKQPTLKSDRADPIGEI